MWLKWIIATLHLLGLPLGLGAVWARSRALRSARIAKDLSAVFVADNLWGLAAVLWIATGLLRVFGGLEKGAAYYLHDRAFYIKMALFVIILLLEVWPMATLIRWRIQTRRGTSINMATAQVLARISATQAGLVVLMACAATAVARGFFY
jgi:putative membrane protein